jgi:enamine deaminase RidA (YjgF/YER057c/UK114 family)
MPQNPQERMLELGLELPQVPMPAASYVPAVRTGNLVFTAGQVSFEDGEIHVTGKVGDAVSLEEAQHAARLCALNALAAAASEAGGLDRISRIIKVVGYVASAPGFNGQPQVVNGASDLLGEIFGENGHHARSAVGVVELPLGVPVEVEMIVELVS